MEEYLQVSLRYHPGDTWWYIDAKSIVPYIWFYYGMDNSPEEM